MIRQLFFATICALMMGTAPAGAVLPEEMLPDPALEARARALSTEIRCQVCQNQTIDDSNAPLAADLRRLVRERLVSGDSDAQVLTYLVQRYGDYVLMRPPVRPSTWPLWFGPSAILVIAAASLVLFLRRRSTSSEVPVQLAADEERRLTDILERRN
jgi:cytochrome c-type biogenesis protein CcmH